AQARGGVHAPGPRGLGGGPLYRSALAGEAPAVRAWTLDQDLVADGRDAPVIGGQERLGVIDHLTPVLRTPVLERVAATGGVVVLAGERADRTGSEPVDRRRLPLAGD